MKELPSQQELLELFSGDFENGELIWRPRSSDYTDHSSRGFANANVIGKHAGHIHKYSGYRLVRIKSVRYHAARILWKLITGNEPQGEIDHINRVKSDDRFVNLRDTTPTENCYNRTKRPNTVSGRKGVWWNRAQNQWGAAITVNGKRTHLGWFPEDRLEQAAEAYREAALKYHGEYACLD